MNIVELFKNRIHYRDSINEQGFSAMSLIVGMGLTTTFAAVGITSFNDPDSGIGGIFNNAKQAQVQSLLQDTITNMVFYDIDGDDETDNDYAVQKFNEVNSKRGFEAYYEKNSDCLAVQIVADNGINAINSDGTNCDILVKKLNDNAEKIKEDFKNNNHSILDGLLSGDNDDTVDESVVAASMVSDDDLNNSGLSDYKKFVKSVVN